MIEELIVSCSTSLINMRLDKDVFYNYAWKILFSDRLKWNRFFHGEHIRSPVSFKLHSHFPIHFEVWSNIQNIENHITSILSFKSPVWLLMLWMFMISVMIIKKFCYNNIVPVLFNTFHPEFFFGGLFLGHSIR